MLADEINRAPAKVQSALLEAMEERQVTVAGKTYKLPDLFMVLATQNPIEQEGTYPLPEAQLDRFLMHVVISYPDEATEGEIIKLNREENAQKPKDHSAEPPPVPQQAIFDARGEIDGIFVSDLAQKYIVDMVFATRFPGRYGDPLGKWIQIGASPRGSLALDRCARVRAWLDGQDVRDARPCARGGARLPAAPPDPELRGAVARRQRRPGDRQDRRTGRGRVRAPMTDGTASIPGVYVSLDDLIALEYRGPQGLVPAAPAGAQPAVRPLRLAHAGPRAQFRGNPRLSPGRRRALDRLEGDGAAAEARMSASSTRSATARRCWWSTSGCRCSSAAGGR